MRNNIFSTPSLILPVGITMVRYKQPANETEKYIDRITTAEDRFDLFMEIGSYRKAAEAAIKLKDGARLQEVRLEN